VAGQALYSESASGTNPGKFIKRHGEFELAINRVLDDEGIANRLKNGKPVDQFLRKRKNDEQKR
jgi:hypothetical protein